MYIHSPSLLLAVCVLFYFPECLRMSEPAAFHHLAAGHFVCRLFGGFEPLILHLKNKPPPCSNSLTSRLTLNSFTVRIKMQCVSGSACK